MLSNLVCIILTTWEYPLLENIKDLISDDEDENREGKSILIFIQASIIHMCSEEEEIADIFSSST